MNFGMPGLNLEGMGKMTQAFGLRYRPDLAVYSFICDDLSTTDSISELHWQRNIFRAMGGSSQLLEPILRLLIPLKMARYTIDFQIIATFPPLYEKRVSLLLGYLSDLARTDGHDIAIVDFCRRDSFRRALARFNQEHGTRIVHINDFEVQLNPNDGHPTRECVAQVTEKLVKTVKQFEQQRAPR
jgi:hypothetical protein